jgi:hypothetical protein
MNRLSNRIKKVESLTCHYHFSGEAHMQFLESKGVTVEAMAWAFEADLQTIALFQQLKERLELLKEQQIKTPKTFWLLGRKIDATTRFLAYVIEYDDQAKEIWNQYLLRIGIAAQEYVQNRAATTEDRAGDQTSESTTAINAR